MKALLVQERGSIPDEVPPIPLTAYLSLFLHTMGVSSFRAWDIEPETGFELETLLEEHDLLLFQGEANGRLRRLILSTLGLSLGLLGGDQHHLRVVGATPLFASEDRPAGFAIQRRGCIIFFAETSLWALRHEMQKAMQTIQANDPPRRPRLPSCFMLEGGGVPLDLSGLAEWEGIQWTQRALPDGDVAILLPSMVGPDAKRHLQAQLEARIWYQEPKLLEEIIGDSLRQQGLTLAIAESCTGGLLSARLTSLPGASAYMHTGLVTYSNESKTRFLEVPRPLIERYGAVSSEVALLMARGAQRASATDLAVAITGIAGPQGGSTEQPVGTVFFAMVDRDGNTKEHVVRFQGGRNRIQLQASQTALHVIRHAIQHLPTI